ncbi:MAG: hypothetical protein IH933_10725 [Euryarchaeota archaeon]|nr:hypothetical protein [Euryarchaeota archaeon]
MSVDSYVAGEQADRAGCERLESEVTLIEQTDEGFTVETEDERIHTQYVVAATKNERQSAKAMSSEDVTGRWVRGADFRWLSRVGPCLFAATTQLYMSASLSNASSRSRAKGAYSDPKQPLGFLPDCRLPLP